MISRLMLVIVAALSLIAAYVHFLVAPEHFQEWWGYGTFFVAAGVAELVYPILLARRPHGWVLQAGIWGSIATLLMFLVSRTRGIPVGPGAGEVEAVETLGVIACLAEAGLVLVLCTLLPGGVRRRTLNAFVAVGAALWLGTFAGALSPSAEARPAAHHHGHGEGHAHGHEHGRNDAHLTARGNPPFPAISDSVRNAPRPPGIG